MGGRDAPYKLAGLVEMDDSYFGGSKPGKEGRGALDKAKVIVSVEDRGRKAGFAKMSTVDSMSGNDISRVAGPHLTDNSKVKTDGWAGYRSALKKQNVEHEYVGLVRVRKPQDSCHGFTRCWLTSKGTLGVFIRESPKSICKDISTSSATGSTSDSGKISYSEEFSALA
jgi:hypothetical protein